MAAFAPACTQPAEQRLQLRFAEERDARQTERVVVHRLDSCGADLSTAAWRQVIPLHDLPFAPSSMNELPLGAGALYAVAIDAECTIVATGCVDAEFSGDRKQTVQVVLRSDEGPCSETKCGCTGTPVITDAGTDAAATDMAQDIGAEPDAGFGDMEADLRSDDLGPQDMLVDACTAPLDYRSAVLADSPALYVRLGEGPGALLAIDQVGVDSPPYRGAVERGVPGALTGDNDTAIKLNYVDGSCGHLAFVLDAQSALFHAFPRSFEFWVRSNTFPDSSTYNAWNIFLTGTYELHGLRIALRPSGALRFGTSANYPGGSAAGTRLEVSPPGSGSMGFIDDAWHHVVITVDADRVVRAYVDGVLVGSVSDYKEVAPPAGDVGGIGCLKGQWGDVFVDEFAVYDTALTPEAALLHYQVGSQGPGCY